MILTCFLPGVTDNFDILFSMSIVSVNPLQRFHRLFCNILFLDFNEAVPETERLDSKALKTRAQLSMKNRRQRPSRTRLYDSVSSTDWEDSLEWKGLRASPESDSGASSLTPVAGSVPFSSDHIAEFQEGPLFSEGEPSSSVGEDTSLSSPSKSDHDTEELPCRNQATTTKILQEKGTVNFGFFLAFVLSDFTNTSICNTRKPGPVSFA